MMMKMVSGLGKAIFQVNGVSLIMEHHITMLKALLIPLYVLNLQRSIEKEFIVLQIYTASCSCAFWTINYLISIATFIQPDIKASFKCCHKYSFQFSF
jgi:hypothetical protein